MLWSDEASLDLSSFRIWAIWAGYALAHEGLGLGLEGLGLLGVPPMLGQWWVRVAPADPV